jgi:hypothetical protein
LPVELLDYISDYLPVESVIAIHRTSKTLALKVPLDDSFCRKGLIKGTLHPHLWDLDTEELQKQQNQCAKSVSWDWRSVAQLLASKRFLAIGRDARLAKLPNGLWNRGRIWGILEEALNQDYPPSSQHTRKVSAGDVRTRRHPVTSGDLEAMLDDMGHWW